MSAPTQKNPNRPLSVHEEKWTRELIDGGYTCLPNIIIEFQHRLGLHPLDMNIILHLASHWWKADQKPYVAKETIAIAVGKHPRTVQRRIATMEALGFIRRESQRYSRTRNNANIYHFDGLIAKAIPFAIEKQQNLEADRMAKAARARRKGPAKLRVVK